MSRTWGIWVLWGALLFSVWGAERPNVVFLLVDDIGWGDLGVYGSQLHETPNIDRLAGEGMRFTQAHSACTVCSPSRAAILSGRSPGRLHLTDWIAGKKLHNTKLLIPDWKMFIAHERVLLPEVFQEAGYATQFVGKWHLMPRNDKQAMKHHRPEDHGFDGNIAGCHYGSPSGREKYFYPFDYPGLEGVGKEGDYLTDILTDKAIEFVESTHAQKPFFLFLSYYTLHGPLNAKPAYVEKYRRKIAVGDYAQTDPVYAGMVQSLDESVGRLMAALKRLGLEKNTIVILTGDNGSKKHENCGGLRGNKGLSYEGGTRGPLIARFPEVIEPNSVCDVPAIGMDFYPTLLELCGLPMRPEEHLDGVSLVPLLKQTGRLGRETFYWHYPHYHATTPYGAIRHKEYKLIEFFEDGALELYDLQNDPFETTNLAASRPEMAQELLTKLRRRRTEIKAQLPERNPEYDPTQKTGKRNLRKKMNRKENK